ERRDVSIAFARARSTADTSMADESEEKNLPASQKKLTDARRKGQTSNSKDLVSGFTMLAATLYLLYQWPMMRDRLVELIDLASTYTPRPVAQTWHPLAAVRVADVARSSGGAHRPRFHLHRAAVRRNLAARGVRHHRCADNDHWSARCPGFRRRRGDGNGGHGRPGILV